MPQYGLHPTTLDGEFAIGACIVIVEVEPVVVITAVAAVSVESGVSVFDAVYSVTPQRYEPAVIAPPVEDT